MPKCIFAILIVYGFGINQLGAQTTQIDNVILITLDGARTQEIFGGLDLDILQSTSGNNPVESTVSYRRYWAPTAKERRGKLMPFFWTTLMQHYGSIAGNRELGSCVKVSNTQLFSYPGYAEILTGESHDDLITSNDNRHYPFPTVLEFLKDSLALTNTQVATFASWETFNWIVSQREGSVTVNAGFEPYEHPEETLQALNRQQFETKTPWDTVRHDFYTFRFAMAHLATYHPKVLYLALGETDDWAHDRRYDRVLDTLHRTDSYLEELWNFLQADDQYRDATAIIITVDHGRGNTPEDWIGHGSDIPGAENIWMAFVSPTVDLRGEWRDHEPITQNQVAATLTRFLGLDFHTLTPTAGVPIARLFQR